MYILIWSFDEVLLLTSNELDGAYRAFLYGKSSKLPGFLLLFHYMSSLDYSFWCMSDDIVGFVIVADYLSVQALLL